MVRIPSTRDSIRDQFVSAMEACDRITARMHRADQLAETRSQVLNDYLPLIIEGVDHLKKMLDRVKDEL
jgi:hypothetical protein